PIYAQRGDVFATVIDRQSKATLETPAAADPKTLIEAWRARLVNRRAIFIGDGTARDAAVIAHAGNGSWHAQTPSALAPQIAIIGRRRALGGQSGPPHKLEPIYVRRPHAEIERERRAPPSPFDNARETT